MKALVAALAGACLLALPAFAAEPASVKPKVAVNRMDPAKGSFHRVHVKKMKLSCDTCHDAKATDVLLVKKPRGSHVTANREACLGCHQSPTKPAWYGPAP
jgi:Fe-S-cluster-containing dehydrogenase component